MSSADRYLCPDCNHPTMRDDPDSIGYLCDRCGARARDEPTPWRPRSVAP